ncbi:T9SS type A sorting domain-containing protein [Flexithrix dorotheae]|uniref:Ig-like domain-containing protein n=1 Tax=Flexithrix dorotheae TaxID=70993 RepID=UPI0003775BDA|nr:T9SS type A sorting domain-containing protein [Flexithrix dorotheae]
MKKFIYILFFMLKAILVYSQRNEPINQNMVLLKGGSEVSIISPGVEELISEQVIGGCEDNPMGGGSTMYQREYARYFYLINPTIVKNQSGNKIGEAFIIQPTIEGLYQFKETYDLVTCKDECINDNISHNCDDVEENEIGVFEINVIDFKRNSEDEILALQDGNALTISDFYTFSDASEVGRLSFSSNVSGGNFNPVNPGEHVVTIAGIFDNGNKEISLNINIVQFELTQGDQFEICSLDNDLIDLRDYYSAIDHPNANIQYRGNGIVNEHFLDLSQLPEGLNKIDIAASGFVNGVKILHLNFIKNPLPDIRSGANQQVCLGETLTLTGNSPIGGTWSSADLEITEQNRIGTVDIQPGTYNVTYTYKNGVCEGESEKQITVLPLPEVSAGEDITWCGEGQISLDGGFPTGGIWTANSNQVTINENFLLTGEVDFEGNLSKRFELTYTYKNENGCNASASKALILYDKPAEPEISYTQICAQGQSTLTIENDNAKFRYDWYRDNQKIVGANGKTYTTDILHKNTIYKVVVINPISTNCQEISSKEVKVTPLPAKPNVTDLVICESENVTLKASHSGAVTHFNWYDQSGNRLNGDSGLGDSYTTLTPITQDATFYVSAIIGGCEGEKQILHVYKVNPPKIPETKGGSICGEGEIDLTVSSLEGDLYRWYKSQTGDEILKEGKSYTPFLTQTTDFYVAAVKQRNIPGIGTIDCEGERAKVTGIIHQIPNPPEGLYFTTCGIQYVELEGKGGIGNNYHWYNSNGSKVGEGSIFKVGQVNRSESYFYTTISAEACESEKAKVEITFKPTPGLPKVTNLEKCGEGEIEIIPEGEEGAIFRFYKANDRDSYVGEGTKYSPYIQGQTSFFVSQVIDNCEGFQQSIEVDFYAIPDAPKVEDVAYCGQNTITLTATGGSTGSEYKWFSNETDETPLAIGSRFIQNDLAITTSYFVSVTSKQGCESDRVKATAFIYEVPEPPEVKEGYVCGGFGHTILNIENPSSDYNYEWYSLNGQLLSNTSLFQTPEISATTAYKVKAISKENCESSFTEVRAVVISDEPIDIGEDISLCKWEENYNLSQDVNENLKGGLFTGSGVFQDSVFMPSVLEAGNYEIQYTYNKGDCKAFGKRKITITDGIGEKELHLNHGTLQFCENANPVSLDDYVFNEKVENSQWEGEGVIGNILEPNLLPPGIHELTYTLTENGCTYTTTQEIEIVKSYGVKPRLSANNITACEHEKVTVSASLNDNNKNYHWYSENNELLGEGPTFSLVAKENQILSCKGVDAQGCESDPSIVTLNVYHFPDSITSNSRKIKVEESIEFDVVDQEAQEHFYNWDFGNGQESTLKSPAVFFYDEGEFPIRLIIAHHKNGCSDTLSYSILVEGRTDSTDLITGFDDGLELEKIKVFPNPFSNWIRIEGSSLHQSRPIEMKDIQVFDLMGRSYSKTSDFLREEKSIYLNTEKFPSGIYFIKVYSKIFKLTKS